MFRSTKVCLEYVNENYMDEENVTSPPSVYEILQLIADAYIYGTAKERKRYFSVVYEVSNEYHLTSAGELHIADLVTQYRAATRDLTPLGHIYRGAKARGDLNDKKYFDFI